MYNISPTFMYEFYQEILADRAKKSQTSALLSTLPVGSRFQDRAAKRIANLLISAGLKLRERYEPATYPAPEAHPSTAGKASI